jgi:hypothetical protein
VWRLAATAATDFGKNPVGLSGGATTAMEVAAPAFPNRDDYPVTRASVQSFFRDGAKTAYGSNFHDAEVKKRKSASE